MAQIYIEDIGKHEGEDIVLRGWLYNKRSSGKLHFLQVRDGTGTIQCVVFKGDVTPEEFALADHLPQESSVAIHGTVRADARSPLGYEVAKLPKQRAPPRCAQFWPFAGRERPMGRGNGAICISRGSGWNQRPRLASKRIVGLEVVARFRSPPLAVDIHLVLGH